MVLGLSAMCMFCSTVHSKDSFILWQSLSEVQGKSCPIRLPVGPHGACPHTHHAERHSFVFLKFSGMTTQNLTARTTTIVRFGTSFGEIFHWRNLPGEICLAKFAWRNLPAKFAGEIGWRNWRQNLRRNLSAKFLAKNNW